MTLNKPEYLAVILIWWFSEFLHRQLKQSPLYTISYLLYSLNKFSRILRINITSKILTLKILSCITILYYLLSIHKIFITKMLKAMNP